MSLTRWVPILNLVFILIELFDPSTSFIRVSHDSATAQPKLVIVQDARDELRPPRGKVALVVSETAQDNMDDSFSLPHVGESHASLVYKPLALFSQFFRELPLILDTGLVNQYCPLPHKRPPIFPAV